MINLIIVLMSYIPKFPFDITKAPVGLGILIVCIGIPIEHHAHLFFKQK